MAQNDVLKKYLEAGLAFTAMTQARAEALVRELVKAGEVQADQARDAVVEVLERSRESSEKLLETIRSEVKAQITNLGLASKADVERAEQRIMGLFASAGGRGRQGTARGSSAQGAAGSKAPAKKAPAKKAPARKTTAKKATAKKTTAKKTPAKRAGAAKRTAKKQAPAKKTTAKKA